MRYLGWIVGLGLTASAGAQTMTEFGAAAAGGTVGGAAGKKVSDGLTAVFGKVDQQTKAAAKAAKEDPAKADKPAATPAATITPAATSFSPAPAAAPAPSSNPAAGSKPAPSPQPAPAKRAASAKAASTSSKRVEPPSVPDPPAPPTHPAVVSKAPAPPPQPRPVVEVAAVVPPPPPPPEMTAQNLKDIAPGAAREDVLKLGIPAARITMFGDGGHLLEIYSYMTKNTTFGIVRLSDGAVSKVELR
jgi:hypothetical protein